MSAARTRRLLDSKIANFVDHPFFPLVALTHSTKSPTRKPCYLSLLLEPGSATFTPLFREQGNIRVAAQISLRLQGIEGGFFSSDHTVSSPLVIPASHNKSQIDSPGWNKIRSATPLINKVCALLHGLMPFNQVLISTYWGLEESKLFSDDPSSLSSLFTNNLYEAVAADLFTSVLPIDYLKFLSKLLLQQPQPTHVVGLVEPGSRNSSMSMRSKEIQQPWTDTPFLYIPSEFHGLNVLGRLCNFRLAQVNAKPAHLRGIIVGKGLEGEVRIAVPILSTSTQAVFWKTFDVQEGDIKGSYLDQELILIPVARENHGPTA